MKERKLHIKKGIITALFLFIVGGLTLNSTFFLHAHKNESGKVVFHAHPFDKGAEKEDPLAKHQHRKIDLNYLASFEYYLIVDNSISLINNSELEVLISTGLDSIVYSNIYTSFSTRAPPQAFFLT